MPPTDAMRAPRFGKPPRGCVALLLSLLSSSRSHLASHNARLQDDGSPSETRKCLTVARGLI
jgi:hypothetical protein